MTPTSKLLSTHLVGILLLALAGPALAEPGHAVSGTVLIEWPSGAKALAKARVEILSPGAQGDDAALQVAYTNSEGQYIFRGVRAGRYDLRISFGGQVLRQRVAGDELVRRRAFRVGGSSIRLPESRVRR